MFESARLKLTAWYLLIVMTISILFSAAIYNLVITELYREFHHFQQRMNQFQLQPPPLEQIIEPEYMDTAEQHVLLNLFYINLGIFLVSACVSYLLAGRTLRPIKTMVDKQNQFITDASHELRTPITSARTSIEVGLRDKKLSLPQAKEVLESTLEDVTTMQILTDNLLTLSKTKNSNQKLFSKVSVSEVIEKAVERTRSLAKAKQIAIIHATGELYVFGDFASLAELMVILIDNAIKYSNKKSTVTVNARKTDGHVEISVADSGMGIEQKDLPYVFDRFYRAEKSRTKTNVSGYGLGLAIAKQTVTEHKGTITVKSIPEKQTTFTVRLPRYTK